MNPMRTVLLPALLLLMAGTVYSLDAPLLKEGLWSIHTESVDQPGNKKTSGERSLCRSHEYDARVERMGKAQMAKCKTIRDSFAGGKRETETECTVGTTVIHTKGTTTMTGDSAAHVETHATYAPPFGGIAETAMTIDQKYVGPCPAGVEPGDSILANGKVQKGAKR
jgi:hypothetical protein